MLRRWLDFGVFQLPPLGFVHRGGDRAGEAWKGALPCPTAPCCSSAPAGQDQAPGGRRLPHAQRRCREKQLPLLFPPRVPLNTRCSPSSPAVTPRCVPLPAAPGQRGALRLGSLTCCPAPVSPCHVLPGGDRSPEPGDVICVQRLGIVILFFIFFSAGKALMQSSGRGRGEPGCPAGAAVALLLW